MGAARSADVQAAPVRAYPSPRLITDAMASGGEVIQRFSMTGAGSAVVERPSTVVPLNDIADVDTAAATLPVNPQRNRIERNPVPGGDGPWQQPGMISEGAGDGHGFEEC